MNREDWFVTPIWFDDVEFDYQAIAKYCLNLRDSAHPNRRFSNVGGWQSKDIIFKDHPELSPIQNIVNQKIKEVNDHISNSIELVLDNIWININEYDNKNVPHVHPSSALSGTIYISVDDSTGNIVFLNDTLIRHYPFIVNDSPLFFKSVSYKPRNGMIIIFPAWALHEVEPNRSSLTRISISFNIKQVRD